MTASADERLLGAVYRRLGRPATYTAPGGQPVNCLVQVYRPGIASRQDVLQPIGFSGHVEIGVAEIAVVVRASEVPSPESSGVFHLFHDAARTQPAAAYPIGGQPMPEDPEGMEWRCMSSVG